MEVNFHLSKHEGKVSALEPWHGQSGWLSVSQFSVEALDHAEDHLIFAAITEEGETIEDEVARRFLSLPAEIGPSVTPGPHADALADLIRVREEAIQRDLSMRNAAFFEAEAEKLDYWADDLKLGLEREIKDLDKQIKELRRAATAAPGLEEKLRCQKEIKALEKKRSDKRRAMFDAQDNIDQHRERLIEEIEAKLTQKTGRQPIFTLRWRLL